MMRWSRVHLPGHMADRGDACYAATTGGRTYVVAVVADHSITATWSDTTRSGPRLGSKELPVGASYPRMSPHVHSIGGAFPSVTEAQRACEQHRRVKTQ